MNIDSVTKIVLSVVQIILLVRFSNYIFYLIAAIVVNFLGNVAISLFLNKENQYDTKNIQPLSESFKNK